MPDGYEIKPTKIARSRKIQIKQYEPEELYIEYAIEVHDQLRASEAVREASAMAKAYLDEEEKRLRNGSTETTSSVKPQISKEVLNKGYKVEITLEGDQLGKFRVAESKNGQYANFVHLWFKKNGDEFYVGHLRRDNGKFTFKTENSSLIDKYEIQMDKHFTIKAE